LEKLERRATFLIERSNFAIEDKVLCRQQLQGIKQLPVIEHLLITRDQPDIFAIEPRFVR